MNQTVPIAKRTRLLISTAAAVAASLISYGCLRYRGYLGSDFNWLWAAARYWVKVGNPYHNPAFALGNPYPFWNPLPYPLPAVIVSLPFAPFGPYIAAALFMGVSSGLLAWGILPEWRRYCPIFFSAPFWVALTVAQWSPLIVAGAFLPIPILALKPNLALAVNFGRPELKGILTAVVVTIIALAFLPSWPRDWLLNLTEHYHPLPILVFPFGPLLLLSLLGWRSPSARILLAMALMPQTPYFYDALPLWLIPETARRAWVLTGASWLSFGGWWLLHHGEAMGPGVWAAPPWIVGLIYCPALALVLWQDVIGDWSRKRLTMATDTVRSR